MKSFLVPLYWLWCGISVFILVRRRVNKKADGAVTPSADASTSATATLEDSFAPFATSTPEARSAANAPALAAPPPDAAPVSMLHPSGPVPPPPAASIAPPSPEARALSLGVPMSTVDTLAEALEGISLPCDLVPLTGPGDFDPKKLVLVADDHPAEVVGTAIADEIEALGFTLTQLDDQRLMALTDDATVEITIHPDVAVSDDAGRVRFPTAPPDGVVVELRLR